MTTYADSVNYYDRYTNLTKEAEHLRFDNVFGAHVTDDPARTVSDLELLQYLTSIATPEEKKELEKLTEKGFNVYNLQAQLVTNPVFKKNLVPMISQAALQEARERGSSYIYRNPGMEALWIPQINTYEEEMPFHNPSAILNVPFLRKYVQSKVIPRTVKLMTEPTEGLTPEALQKDWNPTGFQRQRDGVWTVNGEGRKLNDLETMQLIYSMATDEEKKRFKELFDKRKGYSLNMLQADLVSDETFKSNLIKQLSLAAQQEARQQGSTAIYTNPTLRGLYDTQKAIYDKKMGKGAFQKALLNTPGLNWLTANFPGYGIVDQTRSTMTNVDPNLNWKNINNTTDRRDTWDPLPEKHNGGGDIEYVAPALAVGAPLALLGGMQGGVGAGIGLLGLAGLAGYGYGYGKTRGWKGWDWADKAGDKINGMFSGKPAATPTVPKVPKPPASPTTPPTAPTPQPAAP